MQCRVQGYTCPLANTMLVKCTDNVFGVGKYFDLIMGPRKNSTYSVFSIHTYFIGRGFLHEIGNNQYMMTQVIVAHKYAIVNNFIYSLGGFNICYELNFSVGSVCKKDVK